MINISPINPSVRDIASALNGKWERKTKNETTYVILGQIAFLHGSTTDFPYEVLGWHSDNNHGYWGILK